MDPLMVVASALAGINLLLLVVLTGVWLRNYRTFRTALVAGLVAFGGIMLVESAVAVYFFLTMQDFYAGDPHVQWAVLVLRGLQSLAVAFLTYVTLK